MKIKNNYIQFQKDLCFNPEIREKFIENPRTVLESYDIEFADPREIKVIEDQDDKLHFVIRQPDDISKNNELMEQYQDHSTDFYQRLIGSEEFKKKFKKDPKKCFEEEGYSIPKAIKIEVIEDTPDVTYWVLPNTSEIKEEDLAAISGGGQITQNALGFLSGWKTSPIFMTLFSPVTVPMSALAGGAILYDKIKGDK